jgi:hypothetical protein
MYTNQTVKLKMLINSLRFISEEMEKFHSPIEVDMFHARQKLNVVIESMQRIMETLNKEIADE